MSKLSKAQEKGLMIAHGNKSHRYGKPCKICEEVHADNPYVKRLLARERKKVKKEIKRRYKKEPTYSILDQAIEGILEHD